MSYKVCLVNPGKILQPQPPLGLCYIASYLRKYGLKKYDIIIADENTGENIYKTIRSYKPDIIAISATTPHILRADEICQWIKGLNKDIKVVIGGPHIWALPELTLNTFSFDIGIIGEGEAPFCKLINKLSNNNKLEPELLNNIPGLIFKYEGEIFKTGINIPIQNIDEIPPPARDLLDMKFYLKKEMAVRGHILRATTFFTSRGCPFDCKFCASPYFTGRKVRYHSSEYVVAEILSLINNYPKIEGLFFLDDTFTININRITEICNLFIEKGIGSKIKWTCQGRANLITREHLPVYKLLARAGCIQMEFGFESGSDRILTFIKGKESSAEQNQTAIDIISETGLDIFGNFLVGTPTETKEEMVMTQNFVENNLDKLSFFQMYFTTPYPGTYFWNYYNLSDKADSANFWNVFHSGFSGYDDIFSELLKDVDLEVAKVVEKRVNFLAATKVNFIYKLIWITTRIFYAPSFVIKKILIFGIEKYKSIINSTTAALMRQVRYRRTKPPAVR